ncbi:hypothetical protein C1X61_08075 [Pseudomonas sp. FW215-T2]|nr:hypothetical protein C1X61_08075 [Pseudomonas sp. FW215-T2]PNA13204.1 hypothetical protein C1X62_10425 [Pseudomonas sp. FW215-R3]PNB38036.1 hypothetical protein C1X63_10140 [Pseudomonas sp. FW305-131]
MSVTGVLFSTRLLWLWSLLMVWLLMPQALAQDVSITALFKPDSAHPHLNQFKNTTPLSGYCQLYPEQCEENKTFSLQVPIRFESSRAIPANHASPRQGATIKVPAQWRELSVRHESGAVEQVRMRITGVGSTYVTEDVRKLTGDTNVDSRIAHNLLWGQSWVYAPSPCIYSGVGYYRPTTYGFFWKTPVQAACNKQARFDVPWLHYDHLDFSYELVTPNPLGMLAGNYTGSLTYTVGPNGDFDFGDVMLPSSPVLTMNFNLDVQHTLKVDIPPGGEKVQLVPAGGWQSWLQAGRRPVRLFRDQTFNISASSRFKMYMECEWNSSIYDCQLADRFSRRGVELQVYVTLPNGLTDMSGQPVRHTRLRAGVANALNFQPGFYVDRAPGVLHFEVPETQMQFMLSPGVGPFYQGKVTVIWDSEI